MTIAQRTSADPNSNTAVGAAANSPVASQEKRATALRAAKDARQDFSSSDQERVASNLHRLLEEVSATGALSKRAVAIEAGLGGGVKTDSTKRLDTYTLPDGASETRKARLAKKPGKYFEIAEAVATLLNEPPAPYICQVFEGCTFGTSLEFPTRWDEERWARLADRLRRMGSAIAKQTKVDAYWTEAIQTNGRYDHLTETIFDDARPLDLIGCTAGLSGSQAYPGDLPPIPSVLLGTKRMMEREPAVLFIGEGDEREVLVDLLLEVRLALAPIGRTGEPGPMLEFRSSLTAISQDGDEPLFQRVSFDELDNALLIRALQFGGDESTPLQLRGIAIPEASYRQGCPHTEWAWEEISAGLLREVFGDWVAPIEMVNARPGSPTKKMLPSRFEAGTAAHFLNDHLEGGALEKELAEACRNCDALLGQFKDAISMGILEAEAEADRRWLNLQAE
jgi:hypothetical protein